MDSEQARYRDLFQTLEKESSAAKAARRSGKVAYNVLGAGCAAVIAVYGAGYARTQSAADRFSKQLAIRRVATLPLPGVKVTLDRNNVSHPRIENSTVPTEKPPPPVVEAKHRPTRTAAPHSDVPSSKPEPALESAPVPTAPDVATPAAAPPVFAPPPVIERQADAPPPAPKPADAAPTAAPPAAPTTKWKDGTYTGWGYSRHGNIEAQVVIENGRIASAVISQCRTRYSCSVIDRLPPQIAERQSPEVDYVSGATQSADAFYGAVVEALNKAR